MDNDLLTTITNAAQADIDNPDNVNPFEGMQTALQFATTVYQTLLAAIKNEVTNDPTSQGYANQSNAQITTLLNNPIVTTATNTTYQPVLDGNGNPTKDADNNFITTAVTNSITETSPCRFAIISQGMPFVPNIIDENTVTEALS